MDPALKPSQPAEAALCQLNNQLEQRVLERTAQLQAVNQELEAFSYSVSHDLQAPVRAIEGFAHILAHSHAAQLDPEGRRLLELIRHETVRMGQLIEDLLAFSRTARSPLQRTQLDMTALAKAAFEASMAALTPRPVQFQVEPLPPAQGDPALIRQVFINLVSNALKYTRPRALAHIQVTGRTEGPETIYCVKDNGVGFQSQYAHKLFGVFQRLHTDQEFEGSGVGLALVQRIVRRHDGRVWAEGQLDQGAAFYFTLPSLPSPA